MTDRVVRQAARRVLLDDSLSIEEMIRLLRDVKVERIIRGDRPQLEKRGVVETDLTLIVFNEWIGITRVGRELERRQLRGATLIELLAYAVQFPDDRPARTVIALGTTETDVNANVLVPCLIIERGGRILTSCFAEDGGYDGGKAEVTFDPLCSFLTVHSG